MQFKTWACPILSIFVIVLDQWTKFLAATSLILNEPNVICSFFNLTLVHNTGSAFGFLSSQMGWQLWLLSGIAVVVCFILLIWLFRMPAGLIILPLGISLVIGGALGNLFDRVSLGYVIDFLDFHWKMYHWPVFNVADSAICIGAVLVAWHMVWEEN